MKYISTRGGILPISFKDAVMMGLATDGGLILPESIPNISDRIISDWHQLNYQELAFEVLSLFIDDIPENDLKELVEKSYSTFSADEVAPSVKKGDIYILELFHGPTLAFKDIALQFLGNLFEYLLKESDSYMNIIGATSGDTGSAAIYGIRSKRNINIFILHPHNRVSPIQALQMTSVLDENVFNIAVNGTFDDGQDIVKALFNDVNFKEKYKLGAINSINWARVLTQVVYYIYSYFRVAEKEGVDKVDFSVPTGNFGDIFAGFVARKIIGTDKIGQLVLATNENDILSRFVLNGDYSKSAVVQTVSPSMDIQIASNFERYLYYLNSEDAQKTKEDMEILANSDNLQISSEQSEQVKSDFTAKKVDENMIIGTIKSFFSDTGYVLDPHTAVGVNAAFEQQRSGVPMVCLATAHPGKFSDAVNRAIGEQPLPASLAVLLDKKTRCVVLGAEVDEIKEYIEKKSL